MAGFPGSRRGADGKRLRVAKEGAHGRDTMTAKKQETSKGLRILVVLFSILFTILVIWLLGFVMDDIGTVRGPQYSAIEKKYQDPALVAKRKKLQRNLDDILQQQKNEREKQSLLRDSTNGSKETMDQLLQMQKLGLEKGVKPTPEVQKALANSEQLFLNNQQAYQACNEKLTALTAKQQSIQAEIKGLDESLGAQREQAQKEHVRLMRVHNIKLAALKLLVLIPLLILAVIAFVRWRHGLYAPLVYGSGIAVLFEVLLVMHHHFPTKYFKYLLLLAALAIVVRVLIYVLKTAAAPKSEDWRLRAHREAYKNFVCPSCAFPIKPGALRALLRGGTSPGQAGADEAAPYTCPACGAKVYERCESCGGLRHSFLPFCEKCGAGPAGGGSK